MKPNGETKAVLKLKVKQGGVGNAESKMMKMATFVEITVIYSKGTEMIWVHSSVGLRVELIVDLLIKKWHL